MSTETDERNWTPPDPERRRELFFRYRDEGHIGMLEANYKTPETVETAREHDWPAAYKETAPADEYQAWCYCGDADDPVGDWREARAWIRRHREQHGLDRQVFITEEKHVAPHLRDHEVFLDLDETAREQGLGGWMAFCKCEGMEEPSYYPSYEAAYEAAVSHAAEHGGRWDEGQPESKEELEARA